MIFHLTLLSLTLLDNCATFIWTAFWRYFMFYNKDSKFVAADPHVVPIGIRPCLHAEFFWSFLPFEIILEMYSPTLFWPECELLWWMLQCYWFYLKLPVYYFLNVYQIHYFIWFLLIIYCVQMCPFPWSNSSLFCFNFLFQNNK